MVEPATGAFGERTTRAADSLGYKRLLAFAERHAPGRRVWVIESTGSLGAGLTKADGYWQLATVVGEAGRWAARLCPARRDSAWGC